MGLKAKNLTLAATAVLAVAMLSPPAWSSSDSRLSFSVAAAPLATEGRNRTNERLRTEIFGAFRDADVERYTRWITGDDNQLYPGITESYGGFTSRADGRAQTLSSLRIYNTGAPTFCVRVRARMVGGPLVGRLAQSNTDVNMLIASGESEAIVTYSVRQAVSGTDVLRRDYVIWAPDMSLPERKCSAVAPPWLEQWAAEPATGEDSRMFGDLTRQR